MLIFSFILMLKKKLVGRYSKNGLTDLLSSKEAKYIVLKLASKEAKWLCLLLIKLVLLYLDKQDTLIRF